MGLGGAGEKQQQTAQGKGKGEAVRAMLSKGIDYSQRQGAAPSFIVETFKLLAGFAILAVFGPYVAFQVALCTVWDFADRYSVNLIKLCSYLSEKVSPALSVFTNNKKDGFIVPLTLWLGVVLPGWFFYEMYYCVTVGFVWQRIVFYNIFRIGPMYMNFMYVYVLCHKEAHNSGKLFAKPYNYVLRYVFNNWIGMFHGVLPGTFTYSHIYNHHKYDNDHRDVYSTAFRRRDSVLSWVRYVYEWFGYASNLSTIVSFLGERRYKWAFMTTLSTAWYVAFVAACAYVHPLFALCTVGYAFVEGNILLSVVNFVWHAFIDPENPSNDYVNSTTVVAGLNFTLGEEYHTVHHQYAGAHWSQHTRLYEKHIKDGYEQCLPSSFHKSNLFEIFGLIVSGSYDALAKRYYKPYQGDVTDKELAEVLKSRLQVHGPALAVRVGRTHKAKDLSRRVVNE